MWLSRASDDHYVFNTVDPCLEHRDEKVSPRGELKLRKSMRHRRPKWNPGLSHSFSGSRFPTTLCYTLPPELIRNRLSSFHSGRLQFGPAKILSSWRSPKLKDHQRPVICLLSFVSKIRRAVLKSRGVALFALSSSTHRLNSEVGSPPKCWH